MTSALSDIESDLNDFKKCNKWLYPCEVSELYKNLDLLKMQRAMGKTALFSANRFGSRGASMVIDKKGDVVSESLDSKTYVIVTSVDGVRAEKARPIPNRELWFERVWAKHNKSSH